MAFYSRPTSSAAVKIVNPASSNSEDQLKAQTRKEDSVQRQCRNVLIYGSCKFQDKGCVYFHPPTRDGKQPVLSSELSATSLTAEAVNAPIFIPKTSVSNSVSRQASVASPPPSSPSSQSEYNEQDHYDDHVRSGSSIEDPLDSLSHHMQGLAPPSFYDGHLDAQQYEYDHDAMEAYYPSAQPAFVRQPLNYHLYTSPIPEVFTRNYFISDTIRAELQSRSETIVTAPAPGLNLPEELQGYHTLVPLENMNAGMERRKFGNWNSTVYRATNSSDGVAYALRRIENYRLMHQAAFTAIESWSRIRHPGIISVIEAFTTHAFNDNSLVVAYAYHPNAQTLFEAHLKVKPPTFHYGRQQFQSQSLTAIPERTIWSYIVQIASAIKAVHEAGQAVRMIDITKVLLTGKNRVRISSCGIFDILSYDTSQQPHIRNQEIALLQQEDLVMLGRLIIILCCNNVAAANNPGKALDTIGRIYSLDIKNVILWLMQKGIHKSIAQFSDLISGKILAEMDDAHDAVDRLEGELMSELENARLVRLLCKFGFINERPEFAREQRWSETGDRYIIKLFRDYVFHQVDEAGNPVLNLSHVLTCLNKLDAGTDERMMLVSRDEQNCLVVSYKEVKSCIELAFSDLARGSSAR